MSEHLRLPFYEKEFERKRQGGGGFKPRENRQQFSEIQIYNLAEIKKDFNKDKSKFKQFFDPNLIFKIKLNDFSAENSLTVPSHVIKQDVKGSYLFTVKSNGDSYNVKKIYIGTGVTYEDITVITSGLSAGDKIIVTGYSLVTNGLEVNIQG